MLTEKRKVEALLIHYKPPMYDQTEQNLQSPFIQCHVLFQINRHAMETVFVFVDVKLMTKCILTAPL